MDFCQFAPFARWNRKMPFSVGKGCVFCCFLLVCGAFISTADTFLTATDLRKLRRFGALFSTFLFACFHSGDKPPQWRENFACKSGCNGGKVRCNCAVRCVDLRTDSTPVLLFWISVAWHSPFFVPVGCLSDWSIIVTGWRQKHLNQTVKITAFTWPFG